MNEIQNTLAARTSSESDGTSERDTSRDERVIALLSEVLATEIVGVERYKGHYFAAEMLDDQGTADTFLGQAVKKADHADLIAARIVQLGGTLDFSSASVRRFRPTDHDTPMTLERLTDQGTGEQRIIVGCCRDVLDFLGESDRVTGELVRTVLAQEEGHARDLRCLAQGAARP